MIATEQINMHQPEVKTEVRPWTLEETLDTYEELQGKSIDLALVMKDPDTQPNHAHYNRTIAAQMRAPAELRLKLGRILRQTDTVDRIEAVTKAYEEYFQTQGIYGGIYVVPPKETTLIQPRMRLLIIRGQNAWTAESISEIFPEVDFLPDHHAPPFNTNHKRDTIYTADFALGPTRQRDRNGFMEYFKEKFGDTPRLGTQIATPMTQRRLTTFLSARVI
jgi:hypothetical protein